MPKQSAPVLDDHELASATGTAWSPVVRLLFRFTFLYLALSTWFWLFEFADRAGAIAGKPYLAFWTPVVHWMAAHLFGWSSTIQPSFVRDTRYLYALTTCWLIVASTGTLIWTLAQRTHSEYKTLHQWLRIFLRFTLAYVMLRYGMDKLFLLQFPAPSLARLTERFGDYSPNSLMWAFIGASAPYTIFGGLAEIFGSLLLLSRRTTTLGALILFAVISNVTAMDFCYDVSVKLFCLNLLFMAAVLIAPDATRLIRFFVLNQATEPSNVRALRIRQYRGAIFFKFAVAAYLIFGPFARDWKIYRSTHAAAHASALTGMYEVSQVSVDGVTHPPLVTDGPRWRYVIFDIPGTLTIKHMDESLTSNSIRYDAASHQIFLLGQDGKESAGTLMMGQSAQGDATLDGTMNGSTLRLTMHRIDRSSFSLINRGFHWISETSFVR